ncbi:TetR/AcrR family transcriptional regulator [Cohnella herbarum]|uniref:TetR/AcrR family transcriptional regulator n=1 Tax=Cohnella herbarum TaxID=2728023 RepID=A0A7Z2VEY7_9BACL|nr:TetR/AcrR family transcriptional regulator [Cohnella herbarum]QJD81918.1 TetR/AcrR family transcriptional regulator [Cohnella herbarum]
MFEKYKPSKKKVLETTLRLLRENDLQATSMSMISNESGVSMGSIYNTFSGKEDIVNALYTSIVEFQTEAVLKGFYDEAPIPRRFENAWERVVQTSIDYPDAFQFMEQYSFSPYIYEASKKLAYESNWCGPLSQLYSEAIQEDLFISGNPRLMVQMHWGTIVFLVKGQFQGNLELLPELVQMAIRSCWNSVSTSKGFNLSFED